jgi:EPS-associated MarR family transcriptional regulator
LPRVTKHPSDDLIADLDLLRLLEQHPEYSQRQLSGALGISLGKTHYLLKALLDKGLVKAQNFRRADNKLAYLYVLTPSGARQKVQLTRAFLARKEQEFVSLRDQIAALRGELSARAEAAAEQEGITR